MQSGSHLDSDLVIPQEFYLHYLKYVIESPTLQGLSVSLPDFYVIILWLIMAFKTIMFLKTCLSTPED